MGERARVQAGAKPEVGGGGGLPGDDHAPDAAAGQLRPISGALFGRMDPSWHHSLADCSQNDTSAL